MSKLLIAYNEWLNMFFFNIQEERGEKEQLQKMARDGLMQVRKLEQQS